VTDAEPESAPEAPAEPAAHAVLDVIETVEGYRAAVAAIAAGTGPVAIDAERASGFRYSQRA
jgi:ribonuclease D